MSDVKVTSTITKEDSINQILQWIGLNTEEQRDRFYDGSIDSLSKIRMFTEKDISNLSTDIAVRTQDNGKIHFEVLRTKRMK